MQLFVVCLCERLGELVLHGSIFACVLSQVCCNCSDMSFSLQIDLWMVSCCRRESDTDNMTQGLPKFGIELRAVVGEDNIMNAAP